MLTSPKSKIALIVLAVSVIVSCYNFTNLTSIEKNLNSYGEKRKQNEQQLVYYDNIKSTATVTLMYVMNTFRGTSENFNSDIGLVFLNPNGDFEEFNVYNKLDVPAYYRILSKNLNNNDSGTKICSDISVESSNFNKDHEATIRITSGSTKGYNILQFANKKNDDMFYVLVMVND